MVKIIQIEEQEGVAKSLLRIIPAPTLKCNKTKDYISLDVSPKRRLKNAVTLRFEPKYVSIFASEPQRNRVTAANLKFEPAPKMPGRIRIFGITPKTVEQYEELFRDLLNESIKDVESRQGREGRMK